MFGVIDTSLKPIEPQIFLAKPNRQIIGKLNKHFIYGKSQTINLGNLNEITFNMPYEIEKKIDHTLVRNPYIDKVLERFLLKVQSDDTVEWYIINEIKDDISDSGDIKSAHAFSLGYELADKLIRNYNVTSYSLWQVSNETIDDTLWSIGEVDPIFEGKFRSFDISEATALDFISQIAETFGALIEYDTVNRKIHFRDPAKVGTKQSLTIGYGKYLKSLGKTSNSDEMVTRLYVYGKDGLSINRVNPAGASYLEDFSYFMFPFERDENRNVIQHSKYMSDSLCHAILDYNDLIASKDGVFDSLLDQQEALQEQLTIENTEMFNLNTQLKIIQSTLDVQRAHDSFFYRDSTYNNQSDTIGYGLTKTSYNAVMLKVHSNQLSINIDGTPITIPTLNQWFVAKKITDQEITHTNVSGTGRIEIQIVEISLDEFNGNDNNVILTRYNEFIKQAEVNAKQVEIDGIKLQITSVENQIKEFQNEISIENNFTPEQIKERTQFTIRRTWTDENYFDDKELLEASKEKFLEYKLPKTVINLDIINFLQVLEEQRNWDKLSIGDEIGIRYDKIKVDIRAKITQITFDYDSQSIQLTIANVKDLFGDAARMLEMLKSSYSTSTSVDSSKYKWNEAVDKARFANDKLNQAYDAAEQRITAGAKQTIDISERGMIVRSPDNPSYMIVIQAGVMGLSLDGGLNWQTAIMPEGIVAQRLIGKAIIGEKLEIGDEEGTFLIKGNLLTLKDREDITRLLLGEYQNNKFGLKLYNKSGQDVIIDEDGILQSWQEGRTDNVDVNNGLSLYVYIPEETLSVRIARLRFKLLPFRSYSRTTEAGGSSTQTSSSGGGTTATSSSGGGTTATSSSGGGTTATSSSGGGVSKSTASGGGASTTSEFKTFIEFSAMSGVPQNSVGTENWGYHLHEVRFSGEPFGHAHTINIPSHSHNFDVPSHSHSVTIDSHTHSVSIPNHTHDVSIPNHTHDVSIPNHSHPILHGIYTSTSAYGVGIIINGIERTLALGGKFYTDEQNIDITQYMAVGAWNEITLTSERLGRIDGNIFVQAFMGV
ncbi:phage tail protein [Bacillus sp. T33-2]|uniref:phage tail protein n=1 Tax=Bacillus sp. T33-2 TaxID=2054168 RepID=UPI000C7810F7|nr:phage tail protein [Bacillus sp. T33-2]PLR99653.1 hypothetical protein CVD19_00915 [Bacillus sp. T33-2]